MLLTPHVQQTLLVVSNKIFKLIEFIFLEHELNLMVWTGRIEIMNEQMVKLCIGNRTAHTGIIQFPNEVVLLCSRNFLLFVDRLRYQNFFLLFFSVKVRSRRSFFSFLSIFATYDNKGAFASLFLLFRRFPSLFLLFGFLLISFFPSNDRYSYDIGAFVSLQRLRLLLPVQVRLFDLLSHFRDKLINACSLFFWCRDSVSKA